MSWFKRFWKALSGPLPQNDPAARTYRATHTSETCANFTPRAMQVLALARKEADRFNHNFVGTEHILLGLIALGQGTAVNVLRKMGLDLDTVRLEVEKQVGTGPDQKLIGNIPYTPRVKKVLALAAKEAKALNHTYVGTEHILLGILREGDGVAGRVLQNLDLDIEQTRREILNEIDPNFALDSISTHPAPGNSAAPQTTATKPRFGPIDISKHYDVYCSERNQEVVVYRNALFKGVRKLFPEHRDSLSDFFELEQADGQTVFVSKYSVIKFCEPGVTPNAEIVPGEHP